MFRLLTCIALLVPTLALAQVQVMTDRSAATILGQDSTRGGAKGSGNDNGGKSQADAPSAPQDNCEYKAVMTDEDYRKCGINPGR